MKKQKLCINASNLHNGGGVQVATSFISEIYEGKSDFDIEHITFFVSKAVDENLTAQGVNTKKIKNYEVMDIIGLQALNFRITKKFEGFDGVFSIFGPLYFPKKIKNHIVGFAQPWILYPDNEVSQKFNFYKRLGVWLRFAIQWHFFKFSAARLIVELPHVKKSLVNIKGFPSEKIDVVENCFSSIYLDEKKWRPLSQAIDYSKDVIRLGYISRAYAHKNLQILLPVAKALAEMTEVQFEFFVTLNDSEWQEFPQEYRNVIRNVGPLTAAQCPSFYTSMNGVVFTSLLECFSATPLEALVMHKPLFASNRGFVRDVCAQHATYVDPMNPHDIAQKIFDWFVNKPQAECTAAIEAAYAYVMSLPTARDRALAYWEIIQYQLQTGNIPGRKD